MTVVGTALTQIDPGTGRLVTVQNTGAVDVQIGPVGAILHPGVTRSLEGARGVPMTACAIGGSGSVETTVQAVFTNPPAADPAPSSYAGPAQQQTAARWASLNPILGAGASGVTSDTHEIRVGDGTTRWNDLGVYAFRTDLGAYALKAGGAFTGAQDFSAASVTGLDVAPRALLGAMGESTTVNGSNGYTGGFSTRMADTYLFHLCAASGGRYVPAGVIGQAGISAATLRQTVLPAVLSWPAALRPTAMIVMTGVNDAANSVPLASSASDIKAIVVGLRAAGIEPILTTLLPLSSNGTAKLNARRLSAWISGYAARRGIRLLDAYTPLLDLATGGYAAGLHTGDQIHPSASGHRILGQSFATQMAAWGPTFAQVVPRAVGDPLDAVAGAGFFAVDTNADGVADNWDNWGSGTITRATRSGVAGYVTKATDGSPFLEYLSFSSTLRARRLGISARIWTDGFEASGAASLSVAAASDAAALGAAPDGIVTDLSDARIYFEVDVPSSATTFKLQVFGETPGAAFFEVAELAVTDLSGLPGY